MIRKLLVFTITLLILAAPAFGQWASNYAYGSGAPKTALGGYDEESPVGMYFGIGSVEFEKPAARAGLVYRVNDRLSFSLHTDFLYDNSEKEAEADLGLASYIFVGSQSKVFFSGICAPHIENGEKPDTRGKVGVGYMGHDGKMPIINLDVGTPFILNLTRDITTGVWEYHILAYIEF